MRLMFLALSEVRDSSSHVYIDSKRSFVFLLSVLYNFIMSLSLVLIVPPSFNSLFIRLQFTVKLKPLTIEDKRFDCN